jgi:ABC-type lipopolysaccharide export system ATPase subunit
MFGNLAALYGLDLTVYRGDLFGFIGSNGAGKNRIGSWKLTLPAKGKPTGNWRWRERPPRNGASPHTTLGARYHWPNGSVKRNLSVPERGRCRAEHTGPPAGSRIPGFRGED